MILKGLARKDLPAVPFEPDSSHGYQRGPCLYRPRAPLPTMSSSAEIGEVRGHLGALPFLGIPLGDLKDVAVGVAEIPAALVEGRGWTTVVTDVAESGSGWNRWEHPVVPLDVPGVPRG
jgi:hypothetical protein